MPLAPRMLALRSDCWLAFRASDHRLSPVFVWCKQSTGRGPVFRVNRHLRAAMAAPAARRRSGIRIRPATRGTTARRRFPARTMTRWPQESPPPTSARGRASRSLPASRPPVGRRLGRGRQRRGRQPKAGDFAAIPPGSGPPLGPSFALRRLLQRVGPFRLHAGIPPVPAMRSRVVNRPIAFRPLRPDDAPGVHRPRRIAPPPFVRCARFHGSTFLPFVDRTTGRGPRREWASPRTCDDGTPARLRTCPLSCSPRAPFATGHCAPNAAPHYRPIWPLSPELPAKRRRGRFPWSPPYGRNPAIANRQLIRRRYAPNQPLGPPFVIVGRAGPCNPRHHADHHHQPAE